MGSWDINSETLHEIYEMDYHHMFTEFNVGTARQACLNAEVRMQTEYCLSERKRLESECEKQADLLKNVAFENEKGSLDGKVTELQSSVSTKDLELKELNVVVSSLRSQKDGLVDQVNKLETTCSGLRAQVSGYKRLKEQIEESIFQPWEHPLVVPSRRGCRMGYHLALIMEKLRSLEHVAAYNPSAEVDYTFALQRLCELKLPIHRPEDQATLGETSLLVALDVTYSQLERIRENVAAYIPATVVTTTNLSITFASASIVPPITIEDYEIIGMDGPEDAQGSGQGEAASFPNTVEFEKEELDTTPEHDPPS
ncbi:hypothetical protein Tco_0527875 [Tanacetum coccineum]